MKIEQNKPSALLSIESLYSELTVSEKRIANYILNNKKDIIHLSVTEVAEGSKTSASTVVRTCVKLGYRGFQDFKITIAQEIGNPINTIFEKVKEEDNPLEILRKDIDSIIHTLNLTLKVINRNEFENAAKAICNCHKVAIFGCGNSSAIAFDAAHKFTRAGLNVIACSDPHKQIMISVNLTSDDVAIGISHSGSSKDVVDSIEIAKESGAKIICITNCSKSPITEISDYKLFTASEETKYRIIGLSSRIAQLAIIDALYIYISLKNKKKAIIAMNRTEKALQSKKY